MNVGRLFLHALFSSVLAVVAWHSFDRGSALEKVPRGPYSDECDSRDAPWRSESGEVIDLQVERIVSIDTAWRRCVAGTGRLALKLRGSSDRGVGAKVVVALGARTLWSGFVTDPNQLDLDVPHGGTILIAFVNDRYEPPEDRSLWISDVLFTPR